MDSQNKSDRAMSYAIKIVDEVMEYDGIRAYLHAMKSRHLSTYKHSINVATYAIVCGIELGMKHDELIDLAIAALLHDIGKIFIDKAILDKADVLSRKERAIINRHPVLGYDLICNDINISNEVKAGVLFHHENKDGSGYPKGLKGNDIPMIARIIHVVDVYDALRSKRPYKEEYKNSETIRYLMTHCNTMFDASIVRTFLRTRAGILGNLSPR